MSDDDDAAHNLAETQRRADELQSLLDALPLATGVKDRDGRFLYINAAGAAGYGKPPEAFLGNSERDLLPQGNDVDAILSADREVIDSGRSLTVPGHRFITHEGRTMVLHMTRAPVRFHGEPAVLVTAMDVTEVSAAFAERRRLERRLAEAQRTEGLGLLAGGIAHDFNNLLVGVLGNADLALMHDSPDSRAHGFLERIRTAAGRLAELAHQMLTYSGRSPTRIQPVDLSALAREMIALIGSNISAKIQVSQALPQQLPAVAGDAAQLGQVVVNLVMNAAEAIGDRAGSIRVSTRREFLDSDRVATLTVRSMRGAADYLCLEVADDGPGMDDATRARIFDPFFTTKGHRGRGLGLASVIGIVRAHQAALRVDSTPGQGTRMRVWWPLADELARTQPALARPRVEPRVADKRVLVIDDEPMVRDTAAALLEELGCTVLRAHNGESALALLENERAVDVVLLDLTIPGESADETHRRLRAHVPNAGILLVSGYSEPEVLRSLLKQPRTQFLQKPFSAEQLTQQVEAVLRHEQSPAARLLQ